MSGGFGCQPGFVPAHAPIPEEFAEELRALYANCNRRPGIYRSPTWADATLNATFVEARRKGWALESLAEPLGISREAVRLRALKAADGEALPVPDPPRNPEPPPKPQRPTVSRGVAFELRTLYAIARKVNGATPLGDPSRRVTEELSARLAKLRAEGVPYRLLDEALGAARGTVRMRLASHGYLNRPPSVSAYMGRTNRKSG